MDREELDRYLRIELCYLWSGSCSQTIEGKKIVTSEGDICIFDTQAVHAIEAGGENDILVNILMSREFFDTAFLSRMPRQGIVSEFLAESVTKSRKKKHYLYFKTHGNNRVGEIMEQIISEYYARDIGMEEVMESYVIILFTELQNEQKKKGCGRMIDIAHAKQEFEKYLDEYDREDEQICLKIVHTYGVMKYAGEIARKMECSGEDVELAELIGLLHDIGRFEQIRRFHSFEPGTMDHAVFGAELLFGEEKLIRRFVEDDKFDELIDAAIRKHSDFKLEGIHDARTLFHAKLIRDADKLDNCRVKLEASVEAMLGVSEKAAGEGLISPAVWESCLRRESVLSVDRHVPVDYWVSYLAQYYDINFPETCEIIEEEDYITRIAGRLTYQEQDTRTKLHILTEDLNRYLEMPAVSVKE